MTYTVPPLPYAYDALEPHFDAQHDGNPPRRATTRPTSTTLNKPRWPKAAHQG